MNQTQQECMALQVFRESIKSEIRTFHGRCNQFVDKHLDYLLGMEPTDRIKYILGNLALFETFLHSPHKKHPENFSVDCQETELEELGNHCKKCFPGYKVTWDFDERCEIYIAKIASKEKLLEVQKTLEQVRKEVETKNREITSLHQQEHDLRQVLGC